MVYLYSCSQASCSQASSSCTGSEGKDYPETSSALSRLTLEPCLEAQGGIIPKPSGASSSLEVSKPEFPRYMFNPSKIQGYLLAQFPSVVTKGRMTGKMLFHHPMGDNSLFEDLFSFLRDLLTFTEKGPSIWCPGLTLWSLEKSHPGIRRKYLNVKSILGQQPGLSSMLSSPEMALEAVKLLEIYLLIFRVYLEARRQFSNCIGNREMDALNRSWRHSSSWLSAIKQFKSGTMSHPRLLFAIHVEHPETASWNHTEQVEQREGSSSQEEPEAKKSCCSVQ